MRKKMSGKVTSRDTLAVNDAVYSEVVRKPTSNGGMIASTPKAPPPTDRNSDHIYDLPQDYINHGYCTSARHAHEYLFLSVVSVLVLF